MLPFMIYDTSYKTKMCLAEFKGFAQLYCLCRRVRIRNFVFPALVTAFSPRALLGFGVFKLRRVLVRKVPIVFVSMSTVRVETRSVQLHKHRYRQGGPGVLHQETPQFGI